MLLVVWGERRDDVGWRDLEGGGIGCGEEWYGVRDGVGLGMMWGQGGSGIRDALKLGYFGRLERRWERGR